MAAFEFAEVAAGFVEEQSTIAATVERISYHFGIQHVRQEGTAIAVGFQVHYSLEPNYTPAPIASANSKR